MKNMGIMLLALSGILAGLSKIAELRGRERLLASVINALEILKNEIVTNRTPIRDAVYIMSKDKRLEGFCASVLEYGLSDEKSFSEQFSDAVVDKLSVLPSDCIDALTALSGTLGRYDSYLQSEAIDRCKHRLEAAHAELRSRQRDNERLYLGLYGGLSVIAAIVLI